MTVFETKHERRSLVLTLLIGTGIIALLFLAGLTNMDPPIERGISVTFGSAEAGDGQEMPQATQQTNPQTTSESQITPESSEQQVAEVVTQEMETAPVIASEPDAKEAKIKPEEVKEPEAPKPPKPDVATSEALARILAGNNTNRNTDTGVGSGADQGQQGDPEADPDKSAAYGTGLGLDGDGNYLLGGRSVLHKQIYVQECNEAGRVVVSIEVNRQGQVVRAQAGVRGTTNNSKCLLAPAKRAALETQFNPDPQAPATQIGKIIYNFQLSE